MMNANERNLINAIDAAFAIGSRYVSRAAMLIRNEYERAGDVPEDLDLTRIIEDAEKSLASWHIFSIGDDGYSVSDALDALEAMRAAYNAWRARHMYVIAFRAARERDHVYSDIDTLNELVIDNVLCVSGTRYALWKFTERATHCTRLIESICDRQLENHLLGIINEIGWMEDGRYVGDDPLNRDRGHFRNAMMIKRIKYSAHQPGCNGNPCVCDIPF